MANYPDRMSPTGQWQGQSKTIKVHGQDQGNVVHGFQQLMAIKAQGHPKNVRSQFQILLYFFVWSHMLIAVETKVSKFD
jgi:hypothetical protein